MIKLKELIRKPDYKTRQADLTIACKDFRWLNMAAFTMAEILLSLTIIGVVAAITLPSLTGNINERTWNMQRKALYARMSQAIALMGSLNGYGEYVKEVKSNDSIVTSGIDTAAETFLNEGLAKVLKINNICDSQHLGDCGLPNKLTTFTGNTLYLPQNTKSLIWPITIGEYNYLAAGFETANGESIAVYYNKNCISDNFDYSILHDDSVGNIHQYMCVNFIFDLNGKKGPNTVGKDIGIITAFYPTDPLVVMPVLHFTSPEEIQHEEAVRRCRKFGDKYRLPTMDELMSLFINRKLYYKGDNERHWAVNTWLFNNGRYVWTVYMNAKGVRRVMHNTSSFSFDCVHYR